MRGRQGWPGSRSGTPRTSPATPAASATTDSGSVSSPSAAGASAARLPGGGFDALLTALSSLPYENLSMEREFVVYDSAEVLDAGWITEAEGWVDHE